MLAPHLSSLCLEQVADGDFGFALSLAFGRHHWNVVYFLLDREDEDVDGECDPLVHFLRQCEPGPVDILASVCRRGFGKQLEEALNQLSVEERERVLRAALRQNCFLVAGALMESGQVDVNATAQARRQRKTGAADVVRSKAKASLPTRTTKEVKNSLAPLAATKKGTSFGFQVRLVFQLRVLELRLTN